MDELDFDGKKFLSSKRAAEITGYAKDYVGQLCREGRVEARLVGRAWYVSEASIREHRFGETDHTYPETKIEVASEEPRSLLKKEVENTWGKSMYAPEQVDLVPTLATRTSVDVFSETVSPAPHASSVHHMQSVWQDWFDTKNKENTTRIDLSEDTSTEVFLTKIEEEVDFSFDESPVVEEVAVPIYRMPMRDPERVASREYEERVETRVESAPRQMRGSSKAHKSGSNFILQALLVASMILVVAGTFVALGYGDTFLDFGDNVVTNYLSGVSK